MRENILTDWIIVRWSIVSAMGISLAAALVAAFFSGNPALFIGLMGFQIPYLYLATAFNAEADQGWLNLRLAANPDRASLVAARYVMMLAVMAASAVLSLVLYMALMAGVTALAPAVGVLADWLDNAEISWGAAVLCAVIASFMSGLSGAISFPFMFKSGLTKATTFAPMALFLIMCFGIYAAQGLFKGSAVADWVSGLLASFGTDGVAYLAAAVFVGVTCVAMAISYVVACRVFARRDI